MNRIWDNITHFISNHRIKGLVFIILLTFASYHRVFQNGFVMDDLDFIVNWSLIQSFDNIFRFFVFYIPPDGQIGIYSPLKTVFHSITFFFFGQNPFGYHVASLVVHVFSIIYVYRISALLSEDRFVSFLCSYLFALHPVTTESIAYMTASIDTIGVLFLFISVFHYMRNDNGDKMISIFFTVLAVFTHELAISLPLLILLYEVVYQERRTIYYKLKDVAIYFGIVFFYAYVKFKMFGSISRGEYVYDSFYLTMLIIIKAIAKYLGLLLLPLNLTVNHVISPGIFSYDVEDFDKFAVLNQSIFDLQALISVFCICAALFLIYYFYQKDRNISFCIAWFFCTLFPVSNIIPSGVYFGERYLYPGLFAFCFLIAILIKQLGDRGQRQAILALSLIILLGSFYGYRTHLRIGDWENEIVFYESIVKANPKSAFMNRDLGIAYLNNDEFDKSVKQFEKAVKIKPYNKDLLFSLSDGYLNVRRYEKAQRILIQVIDSDPEFAESYYNLAGIYAYLGDSPSANRALKRAVQEYRKQGRYIEAYQGAKALREYFGEELNRNTQYQQ